MLYQLRKLVQRHRFAFGLGALIAAMILALAVVSTVFALGLSQQQRELLAARHSAECQRVTAELNAYVAALAGAEAALRAGNVNASRVCLEQALAPLRNWEWRYYWRALDQSLRQIRMPSTAYGLALAADGRHLATACRDGQVRVWDTESWMMVASLPAQTRGGVQVAFSPRDELLAVAAPEHGVRVWNLCSISDVAWATGHGAPVTGVAFGPDGTRLATSSADGTVRVWRVPPDLASAPVAPSGSLLPLVSLETELTLSGHAATVTAVAFSPDGCRPASAGADRSVMLWDAATGQLVHILRGHSGPVTAVQFSPDGRQLVSTGHDGLLKVWETRSGRELLSLHEHDALVSSVAWSPDGTRLASAAWDKRVRIWDAGGGEVLACWLGHTDNPTSVVFTPAGDQLITAAADESLRVWPAVDRSVLAIAEPSVTRVERVPFTWTRGQIREVA